MPPGPPSLGEVIVARCRDLGFALAGVCPAQPSARGEFFRAWLREGRHGTMAWLARDPDTRLEPARLLPGARSIIMVGDLYVPRGGGAGAEQPPPGHGKIARYARGADYHDVMKGRLHALCDALRREHPSQQFRACVDTAPLMEREHAARAGLGWVGKHTLLIHPVLGSYFFLGGVVTTLPLEPPPDQEQTADHCGTCTRCIDACPTSAITPYSVDASRCIAYLTIENRGREPAAQPAAREGWLFGCDICQEVCPHNSPRDAGGNPPNIDPRYAPRCVSLPILAVEAWTDGDRAQACRNRAMRRATLEMWRRNASACRNQSPGTAGRG